MSRQNRVRPDGQIIASAARGTLMGNRGGCLHDAEGQLGTARWANRRWIICLLEFRGRQRTIMAPGRYTKLFFLDEATALAAGHRPCAECQRQALNRFKDAWLRGNAGLGLAPGVSIDAIDQQLHGERVNRWREQATHRAAPLVLPDGVMLRLDGSPEDAWLLWRGTLHRWSPEGYRERRSVVPGREVDVLTPRSTVRAIAAGYTPALHPGIAAG